MSVNSKTQTIEVLVAVKAYPTASSRYGETVCVAGVRVDRQPYEFIRLKAVRQDPGRDPRRESWRPVEESIEPGPRVEPTANWADRGRFIDQLVGPTMCDLNRAGGGATGPSLGVVRPREVIDVLADPAEDWTLGQLGIVGQGNLLAAGPKRLLVKPGHDFRYWYQCEDPGCPGHKQKIVDWELGEAYRKWSNITTDVVAHVRGKWLDEMCAPDREPMFFVGDLAQYPGSFVVLGTFWPRLRPDASQLSFTVAA